MFLDLDVARKIEDLSVNVREKFFVCRRPGGGTNHDEWHVWLSTQVERARAEAQTNLALQQERAAEEETKLERQLRASIDAVNQVKWGEVGDGTFVVPTGVSVGASAGTPAPVEADAQNGQQASDNGNGSTNGKSPSVNGNGIGEGKRPDSDAPAPWAKAILGQTDALVDIYAAALSTASTKHGNQIKPEDVRSLLVTVFIQRSKEGAYVR